MTNFGPTGQLIYERTYSRTKPDGSKETWPETVERVVDGNLGLVDEKYHDPGEREALIEMIRDFKVIPAGRHLWASGVPGRQYLFNCHVSGWEPGDVTKHFSFTFLRLMEGGGVGANYSNSYLVDYPWVEGWQRGEVTSRAGIFGVPYEVHIVCDPEHPDYQKMLDAGVLSTEYDAEWDGSFAVEDSREGWADALVDLIGTYYREAKNYNRVFDVSRVRGEGSRLKTFGGRASGPLPLAKMLIEVSEVMNGCIGRRLDGISAMEIDHAIATCVVSGGNRRSARMAIMHWADPQIGEFLTCKADTGKHWTTNISVEVDDEFFEQVYETETVGTWGQPDLKNVPVNAASHVLQKIASGMLDNGEPGIWNSSHSNVGEPNEVISTNPCGEIALEPWENCNLGHVNLAAFVKDDWRFDPDELADAHRLMTRFLIRATYGDVNDEGQADVLARNRRIGVGHLGVASALALMGIRYSDAAQTAFPRVLEGLAEEVDRAATEYAHQLRIPVPVKTRTVAPTGTIAKMPGVSEGIHPIFAKYFIRRVRFSTVDPEQVATMDEYRAKGYSVDPCLYAPDTVVVSIPTKDSLVEQVEARFGDKADEIVESAADLTLYDMLAFQAMYQASWADNAVSYTVNIDPRDYTRDELIDAIEYWGPVLKGATVFPELSRPQSPYERISKADYALYELWQRDVSDGIDEACVNGCPIK